MTQLDILAQIEESIPSAIIFVVIAVLVRQPIERILSGLIFYFGKTFNNDDIVYIDGDKARISRIGVFNTYFDILGGKSKAIKVRVVPNHRILYLKLEKVIRYSKEEKNEK